MRVIYDGDQDVAFIQLSDEHIEPEVGGLLVDTPADVEAMVLLDWHEGRLVGIHLSDEASRHLPVELLLDA